MEAVRELVVARCHDVVAGQRTATRRRSRLLGGVLVGLTMVTAGCGATSPPSGGDPVGSAGMRGSSLSVPPNPIASQADTDERACEVVATVLFLTVERIMVVAADAPSAEQEAVEQAYVDARRAVPAGLRDALGEVEQVYDRIGVDYLALVADIRRGEVHDQAEVAEVFESRRPELRQIFERTRLDESCERLGGRTRVGGSERWSGSPSAE